MSETVINSKGYWNERFGDDWEDLGGREQSRFFGAVALQMMPAWLVQASNRQQLSWCDWGCALGDGTNEIAQGMPGTTFTGVDFSAVAIADAAERFPGQQFISEDWLAPGATPAVNRFDVLFSSNTLEHFHTPWDVLCDHRAAGAALHRADAAVPRATPYRGAPRLLHARQHPAADRWQGAGACAGARYPP
ncbi:class I SAM-dependent methyltransferase [Stenotrophomonas rhizophila]